MFSLKQSKARRVIIYSSTTKREVIREALAQFEKRNTAYLAICLNFNLGLRIGELVALRESDIDGDTIHICRGEVKNYTKDENGKIVRNGYKVAQHPKTDAGIRTLVLTPDAKKYIKMTLDENKANVRNDEDYIFVSKSGERMHEYAVNMSSQCNGLRNEKAALLFLETKRKSCNQKTCISELH